MLRKYWVVGLLVGQVVLFLMLLSVFLRQPAVSASAPAAPDLAPPQAGEAAPLAQPPNGQYIWSFAAKFVCGFQPSTAAGANSQGEPVVKPGNYATEINIHNYNYKVSPLRKKFIVLVNGQQQQVIREPEQAAPRAITRIELGPDFATMDDCNGLWQTTYSTTTVPTPMPLFIGYLVILSPFDLDVDAAYTANAPGTLGAAPTGISIDVERVTGKRVFLPVGAVP